MNLEIIDNDLLSFMNSISGVNIKKTASVSVIQPGLLLKGTKHCKGIDMSILFIGKQIKVKRLPGFFIHRLD